LKIAGCRDDNAIGDAGKRQRQLERRFLFGRGEHARQWREALSFDQQNGFSRGDWDVHRARDIGAYLDAHARIPRGN
jgi:hypothetical protein